jgi:hypothetical protein
VGHEVGEDEDGDHKHREQREGRGVGPHCPYYSIPHLVQQAAVSDGSAQRAAATQEQQYVPVQRLEVSDVEDARAVQHLRA